MMRILDDLARLPRSFARDMRMSKVQALVFLTSWWCWTLGSAQFYILPYTQPDVAAALGVRQSEIAYANSTSMLSRTLGAIVFGILSDQYGRKLPLVADLVLMGVFTLCSGLVQTYAQFIGLRFLFGQPLRGDVSKSWPPKQMSCWADQDS